MPAQEEQKSVNYISDNADPRKCKTIFYQGIICSQTQISKYTGENPITTTTGEYVICRGRNYLKPLDVLINPFIGKEIKDVNTAPFDTLTSQFNPIKLLSASISWVTNWYHGIEVYDPNPAYDKHSINAHTINLSEVSIGQETDIESHLEKYKLCKAEDPNIDIIAYGVSRGAATTFVSLAKNYAEGHYSEVKLVVLEGCFRSLKDTLHLNTFKPLWSAFKTGLSLFTKYRENGPSPEKCVADFPKNLPVVFITSEIDQVVPCWSTEKLAHELADKGDNEVYLLKLKNSSHPNYMFDDREDRERYETFIHAIYKRYHLPYIAKFAERGEKLLHECLLNREEPDVVNYYRSAR